jgi:WD40 repeat protein
MPYFQSRKFFAILLVLWFSATLQVAQEDAEYREILRWGETNRRSPDWKAWSDVAWSPAGDKIATSNGFALYLWNAEDGTLLRVIEEVPFSAFDWSPDGTQIVGARNDKVISLEFWDVETGEIVDSIEGVSNETQYGPYVGDIAWSPKGDYVVTTGLYLLLWNLENRKPPTILGGVGEQGYTVQWDGVGNRFVSGWIVTSAECTCNNYNVIVRDVSSEQIPFVNWFIGSRIAAISPDGLKVAFLTDGLKILDVSTGEVSVSTEALGGGITELSWNSTQQRIASSDSYGRIFVYDGVSGELLQTVSDHDNSVYFDWSPEGDKFVSASVEGSIAVWIGNG